MKKLVSLLLVLALFCTVAFVGVYAEGEEEEENLLEIVGIAFDSVVVGEAVEFVRGGAESRFYRHQLGLSRQKDRQQGRRCCHFARYPEDGAPHRGGRQGG